MLTADLSASTTFTSAQAVKKQIESEGGQCLCVPGDLMKDETCETVVKKHMEKYGHLEILINNVSRAGV
jgi:short-subunit dehydrogenase